MRNISRSDQSAFTLVETLMAMLILIVGLLGVAQLFIASTYSNTYAQNTSIAIKAAEDMMEELRSITNWADLRIQPGGTVRMLSDGGPSVELPPSSDPNANYVAGIYLESVLEGGRHKNLNMKPVLPGGANWDKRRFEIRWQVIGYNNANQVAGVRLNDAYNANPNIGTAPNFSNLSSPTPVRADGRQSSVWVIMRVTPMADRAIVSKRVQIASLLAHP